MFETIKMSNRIDINKDLPTFSFAFSNMLEMKIVNLKFQFLLVIMNIDMDFQ